MNRTWILGWFALSCLLMGCQRPAPSTEQNMPKVGEVPSSTTSALPEDANGGQQPAAPSQSPDPANTLDPTDQPKSTAPHDTGDAAVLRPSYDECLKAAVGVVPDMQDCIGAEHEYQDGRLNKVYQALLSKLDKPGQLALRTEQRKWLTDRDAECSLDPEWGQGQRLEANDCMLEITARRASELEVR